MWGIAEDKVDENVTFPSLNMHDPFLMSQTYFGCICIEKLYVIIQINNYHNMCINFCGQWIEYESIEYET